MKKKKRGPKAPTKFNRTTVSKLEMAFSIGSNVAEACVCAGISRETYYKHTNSNHKLSDRFKALRLNPIIKARQTIFDNISDPKVAMWYLERKRRDEFGKVDKIRDMNPVFPPVQITVVDPSIEGRDL